MAFTSAPTANLSRFPVYVPLISALVVSALSSFEMIAVPFLVPSISYLFLIFATVSVSSFPSLRVTVTFVPSDTTLVTFADLLFASSGFSIVISALLDTNCTVPIFISPLSDNVAAVVPFALTVTPSTVPIVSPAANALVFH